jgi:hypothetical protein
MDSRLARYYKKGMLEISSLLREDQPLRINGRAGNSTEMWNLATHVLFCAAMPETEVDSTSFVLVLTNKHNGRIYRGVSSVSRISAE